MIKPIRVLTIRMAALKAHRIKRLPILWFSRETKLHPAGPQLDCAQYSCCGGGHGRAALGRPKYAREVQIAAYETSIAAVTLVRAKRVWVL